MNIQFFCPHWGSEHLEFNTFLDTAKSEGYDGIEMHLPLTIKERNEVLDALNQRGLLLIAQQHLDISYVTFEDYKKAFETRLRINASAKAVSLNLHTGRDYFTFEQNVSLLRLVEEVEAEFNIPITHELHRGHFNFSGIHTMPYLNTFPDLKFTADFSHWCCVSESLLEGQDEMVDAVCRNSTHIHARIGYSQSPQVPDPRDLRWKNEVQAHLNWWDKIVHYTKQEKKATLYITPEFGPFPYMTYHPNSDKPLASQWEINVYMMRLLKERYL